MRFIYTLFCLFLFHTTQAQTWTPLNTIGDTPARANASMIYHSVENALYVFGGRTSAGFQNDLWKFDLATNTWSEVAVTGVLPVIRHTQNALFDADNNQMLIFSGQGSALYNDIWSFDFDNLTWTERSPNGNGVGLPQKRYGTVTVFDPSAQRLVTFGGFGGGGTARQDDTWAFDLNSNAWTELLPSPHPIKRCLHNGTYVAGRELMVMYGGQSGGNRDDIWTFDLATNSWTERLPSSKPPGRHFCSVTAIDEDQLYLFGGNGANQNNFSGALNDLWRFSLIDDSWTSIQAINNLPPPRVGHCAVFLPNSNQLLIFGGNASDGSYLDDVWVFADLTTSIEEQTAIEGLAIQWQSANPFSDHLNFALQLERSMELRINLLNVEGKMAHTFGQRAFGLGQHDFFASTETLTAGNYFLQISDQNGAVLKTIQLVKH